MPILFAMRVDIFSIAENRKYTFFMYSKGKEFLNPKKISQSICSLYQIQKRNRGRDFSGKRNHAGKSLPGVHAGSGSGKTPGAGAAAL